MGGRIDDLVYRTATTEIARCSELIEKRNVIYFFRYEQFVSGQDEPERQRWSYLARSGYGLCPARKIYHALVFSPI